MAGARGGVVATLPQGKGRASGLSQAVCSYRMLTLGGASGAPVGTWRMLAEWPASIFDGAGFSDLIVAKIHVQDIWQHKFI